MSKLCNEQFAMLPNLICLFYGNAETGDFEYYRPLCFVTWQAVSVISKYNFAPTVMSRDNLLRERKKNTIYVTGNTAIDALKTTVRKDYSHPELEWAKGSRLIMLTAHRRENLGLPMHHMFRAIRRIMDEHQDVKAIYPIHMNPIVRQIADEELGGCDRIRIIEPLDVLDFHNFLARSFMILTDSGGIQEEAYNKMANASNPYGDGLAAKRIADILEMEDIE